MSFSLISIFHKVPGKNLRSVQEGKLVFFILRVPNAVKLFKLWGIPFCIFLIWHSDTNRRENNLYPGLHRGSTRLVRRVIPAYAGIQESGS